MKASIHCSKMFRNTAILDIRDRNFNKIFAWFDCFACLAIRWKYKYIMGHKYQISF